MAEISARWSLVESDPCPEAWLEAVRQAIGQPGGESPRWAAQLLWQRQLCSLENLPGFLQPARYNPTPAAAFGAELAQAVERLLSALAKGEKVAIWGDFDADGVTATAVLWDGLGALFEKHGQLTYYIPNRITESHGLSKSGLDQLHRWGARVVVTCDTGSTNGPEIDYANHLGLDVIVTDHHTLADERPSVIALINPRYLPADHPLASLSGVAVAYKLLEGLYAALESPPSQALEVLLDLVAIGLIADLVELKGDCRYLAQMGLRRLQTHLQGNGMARPGVAELLSLCKRTGDRPTDVSFGIGPRINAVSRIHGDASFCVELLTSREAGRCKALAHEAELANTRRKALQQEMYQQVMAQVSHTDLATTQCLVLASEQWPAGILGLVAGQVSQALGRPTVLLRLDPPGDGADPRMARGSARSVRGLDLYGLFQSQADLLSSFGGHPLAAGLTLPAENVPMLWAALNRAVREALGGSVVQPTLDVDLTVTVTDLGKSLFRELKLLEPYGMGNPVPRLLIRNAWFERGFHRKLRDRTGRAVRFIKTQFELWDDSTQSGFPGEWWGHYRDELPQGRCDVVVELDHNAHQGYHVKLVDFRGVAPALVDAIAQSADQVLDWPQTPPSAQYGALPILDLETDGTPVEGGAMASMAPVEIWQQLVGIGKYLDRTGADVSPQQLMQKLQLSPPSLAMGLKTLAEAGFAVEAWPDEGPKRIRIRQIQPPTAAYPTQVRDFLDILQEEQFRRRYWARAITQ